MSGRVIFKPIEAKLTRDTELVGKMDPYVKAIIGDKKAKGKVCENGGKTPKWNDSFNVKRRFEPVCFIEVIDEDPGKDDIIGVGQIDLSHLVPKVPSKKWHPIYYKQKQAGEILIEVTFIPRGKSQPKYDSDSSSDDEKHKHKAHQKPTHPHWCH